MNKNSKLLKNLIKIKNVYILNYFCSNGNLNIFRNNNHLNQTFGRYETMKEIKS